jgi:NADH:ubiquinone oxidoreductase subunit 5 (subunit L)/multisubunit Na+/H+ antiporter MnhA subunit
MMKLVDSNTLSIVLLLPLLAAAVTAAAPARFARLLAGIGGVVGGAVAVGHAVACATAGGFADQAGGGYIGARLLARVSLPGFSLRLELEPLTAPLLLATGVVTGAGLVGLALRRGGRGALTAGLLLQAGLVAMVVVGDMAALVAAFVALGMLTTLSPLTSLGARPAGNAALRAFALQRVGDGALILGMLALSTSLGNLGFERVLVVPLDVDPWARVAEGGLFGGQAHRTLWFFAGSGVAVAVATRLGLLCWPLLRDLTASRDLPAPLVGLVQAAQQGAAAVLLVRLLPVLSLAPEASDGLVWVAAVTAVVAGLLGCAGRDLLRIDTHLLAAAALPMVTLASLGQVSGLVLGAMVAMAAGLALPWAMVELVAARGERDPVALGGLEHVLPRLHTTRLLTTAALGLLPPFAGWVVLERALEAGLLSTKIPAPLYAIIVVGAVVGAMGAWRVLHLVYNGAPPDPLPVVVGAPLLATLPVLLVAFVVPGLALLEMPGLFLRLLPLELDYSGPLRTFLAPSVVEYGGVLTLLGAPQQSPALPPTTFILLVLGLGVLPWLLSALLWRGRRGAPPPGRPLLQSSPVAVVAARLATMAGRESPVARSVSEGVERLSRVLATNMVPMALALVLQRLPGLAASLVAFVLGGTANGGAQRALVLSCVLVAWVLWLGMKTG